MWSVPTGTRSQFVGSPAGRSTGVPTPPPGSRSRWPICVASVWLGFGGCFRRRIVLSANSTPPDPNPAPRRRAYLRSGPDRDRRTVGQAIPPPPEPGEHGGLPVGQKSSQVTRLVVQTA